MIVFSQPFSDTEWILPAITNCQEVHLVGRKRGHDEGCEDKQELRQMHARCPNKKAKLDGSFQDVSNASNTRNDLWAPHEILADASDWKFEPLVEQRDVVMEEDVPQKEAVDVDRVVAILLEAMNGPSCGALSLEPPAYPHWRRPTSPLSNSDCRMPFIRKSVGGPFRGKRDPGLRRWVVCKNHVEDICSFHPSCRSSDWVEALHEMGWEHLHPTYAFQSQQTIGVADACSNAFDEWMHIDAPEDNAQTQRKEAEKVTRETQKLGNGLVMGLQEYSCDPELSAGMPSKSMALLT